MGPETKQCQSCKSDFIIEPEDFAFYEKINVPPPSWCPECRMIRRQIFRNERVLYRRNCALCGKGTITMYAPEKPFTVYCNECYQSDKWDALSYGKDYDFSKPFFEQFKELMLKTPRRSLYIDFATNSDYSNWAVYLNNSYLVFGGHHYENCSYCANDFYLNDCVDVDFSQRSESCFHSIHVRRCARVHFSLYSEDCMDSWFLFGCKNCVHCVGCTNLRNKSYCIYNEQYSKEEYEQKLKELRLTTYSGIQNVSAEFSKHSLDFPRKHAWVRNVVNSTGDNLDQTKNCTYLFHATEDEDCRYSFFVPTGAKDSYDIDHVGLGVEMAYELHSAFGNSRVVGGNRVYWSHDVYYSDDCYNSANLFGCIGVRKKEYCILNKKYPKEQYEVLVSKIIDHMNADPFVDKQERRYAFGEFFPPALSPFVYNETVAQEYFPLSEDDARRAGFGWRTPDAKAYVISRKAGDLPDAISDVPDNIIRETIGCAHEGKCNEQCTTAFKIIPDELRFYKKSGLPLPRLCSNCRHAERIKLANPTHLSHGKCRCAGAQSLNGAFKNTAQHFHGLDQCPNEFETPFNSKRPEIVYCESCYNAEVA
ncbi:MAG: hypothetical protein AAB759_01810 [Patescibacteria group bacterium]